MALLLAAPALAARELRPGMAHRAAYADLADLALAAPVVLAARVHSVVRVGRRNAPGLAPGVRRYLVRADVQAALVAPGPVPARVEYLWDVASPDRPDIDDEDALLFLAPDPAAPDRFRLVSPVAQLAADPGLETRVRAILKAAHAAPPPPARVTAVTRASVTPGDVPGASSTQIFADTADGRPVSLVVSTHPGAAKRWGAALGDAIGDDVAPPPRDTIAWYRLACGLPAKLPEAATADLDEGARATAAADYAFVLKDLGSCGRSPANEASSTPTDAQSG